MIYRDNEGHHAVDDSMRKSAQERTAEALEEIADHLKRLLPADEPEDEEQQEAHP